VSALVTSTVFNGTREISSVLLPTVLVTTENVEAVVIDIGFRSWAEICVGEYAAFCPPYALS
jgi:hypothetical protein